MIGIERLSTAASQQFELLIDSKQAAALLHVHPKTLQRWASEGVVPGRKIGRCWYFRASELDAWWKGVHSFPPSVRVQ